METVRTREFFGFAHPIEIINATDKYCCSHYGSNLWGLRSDAAEMLYSSWRTNVKLSWNIPRNCHSYFINALLAPHTVSPKISLMYRFHKFFHSLLISPSSEVQFLARLAARDLRTNTGSNLAYLRDETGLDP